MSAKPIEHTITVETRQRFSHAAGAHTQYRPTCTCRRYASGWGYTRENAESRGRAHVQRAQAADARRAGIIAGAARAPLTGKHRAREEGGRS